MSADKSEYAVVIPEKLQLLLDKFGLLGIVASSPLLLFGLRLIQVPTAENRKREPEITLSDKEQLRELIDELLLHTHGGASEYLNVHSIFQRVLFPNSSESVSENYFFHRSRHPEMYYTYPQSNNLPPVYARMLTMSQVFKHNADLNKKNSFNTYIQEELISLQLFYLAQLFQKLDIPKSFNLDNIHALRKKIAMSRDHIAERRKSPNVEEHRLISFSDDLDFLISRVTEYIYRVKPLVPGSAVKQLEQVTLKLEGADRSNIENLFLNSDGSAPNISAADLLTSLVPLESRASYSSLLVAIAEIDTVFSRAVSDNVEDGIWDHSVVSAIQSELELILNAGILLRGADEQTIQSEIRINNNTAKFLLKNSVKFIQNDSQTQGKERYDEKLVRMLLRLQAIRKTLYPETQNAARLKKRQSK